MRHFYIFIIFFSLACGTKETRKKNAVLSIQEIGELAAVEYTVTKIIKASDNKTWFKVGDRKILMTCEAVIKAGVDLSKINKNNFVIEETHVTVTLPAPHVISMSIPPEKIITAYEEIGPLREPFSSSERDAMAAQAEKQIRNSIDSLGILLQAKANTGMLVNNLLKQLGYENIIIKYADDKSHSILQ